LRQVSVIAARLLAERRPGLHGNLAVGLRRKMQDDFGGVDIGLDAGTTRTRAAVDPRVELAELTHLLFSLPADAFAAVTEPVGERPKRGQAAVGIGIVALDNGDLRRGHARHEIAFAFFPVAHLEWLRKLARRVVQDRRQYHVALDPEVARYQLGEAPSD